MDYFAIDMKKLPRLLSSAPALECLSFNERDFSKSARPRSSLNFGLILEADFQKVCYIRDGKRKEANIPACVMTSPGHVFQQNNQAPCKKLVFNYSPEVHSQFSFFANEEQYLSSFVMTEEIFQLIGKIFHLAKNVFFPGNADRLDIAAAAILAEIASGRMISSDLFQNENAAILAIASHMEIYYAEDINWETLAKKHGLSVRSFYRHWLLHFPIPPGEWLRNKRLSEAKTLLLKTAMPIQDIATRVGICDSFYFSRLFRRVVGTSPTEFRHLNCMNAE